ncbi:MAG: single-stranded DNA-binding protein [Eubacteriales bacterium]
MNKAILVGRLTKDPELRSTASGIPVCSFTMACDRRFVKQGEERKADFINCIAWQKSAESIAQYFKKGHRIALEGSIQTRSWTDNEGKNRYSTEVVVEQWEFAQSKSEGGAVGQAVPGAAHFPNSTPTEPLDGDLDGFMPIEDDDLPF